MKDFFKLSTLIILLLSVQVAAAQDDVIREDRQVSGFSAVKASGIANVYLEKGNQEKVSVEVNDKDFNDRLSVKVVNQVLVIRLENTEKWQNRTKNVKLKVFVTYKDLNSLEGSGATNFFSEGLINASDFDVKLSGANNTKLDINAKKLEVETSGASNITLAGEVDDLSVRSSGASNVKAYDLKAGDVDAESSGVSNIYVSAQGELEIKASGLSNVNYKGDAKVITKEVSKMANVKKH